MLADRPDHQPLDSGRRLHRVGVGRRPLGRPFRPLTGTHRTTSARVRASALLGTGGGSHFLTQGRPYRPGSGSGVDGTSKGVFALRVKCGARPSQTPRGWVRLTAVRYGDDLVSRRERRPIRLETLSRAKISDRYEFPFGEIIDRFSAPDRAYHFDYVVPSSQFFFFGIWGGASWI